MGKIMSEEVVVNKTELNETEQVIYDHFKSKYSELDWMLKKRVYSQVTDLLNEGTGKWCEYEGVIHGVHDCGMNNFSPYYNSPLFIIGYEDTLFDIYEKEFGFDNDTVELSVYAESCMGITQLENDFYDELYNYSRDVVVTFWTIMEKKGAFYLSALLDELYKKRLFVVPVKELGKPVTYWGETESKGGNFSNPKLQLNWCYRYVGDVSITKVPMTENFLKRHEEKMLFLDTDKIEFNNITPVFSEVHSKTWNEENKSFELKVA